MDFVIKQKRINDDLLIVLGDNLFDFDLNSMITFFNKINGITVGIYDLKDWEQAKNFGVFEVKNNKLISFEEKPQNPKSTIISTGVYLFPKKDLKKIREYMETDKPKDGPGYLILDFFRSQNIHVFEFKGKWLDIGTKEIYEEAKKGWR